MTKIMQNNKNKRTVIILILGILGALCITSLLVWQGLKKPELSKTQDASVLNQATETTSIGNDLFLRTGGGNFSVSIPACAIDQEQRIILTPLGQYIGAQGPADTNPTRSKAVDISFIDPDNQMIEHMELSCPIQVCFTLDPDVWAYYLDFPAVFEIQYLNSGTTPPTWVSQPIYMNYENHEVCTSYNRLGLFALAFQARGETTETPTQPGLYEPPAH